VKFDISQVLFIDVVGYSKLLIAQQTDHLKNGANRPRNGIISDCRRATANCDDFPRVMEERWFFAIIPRHRFCALEISELYTAIRKFRFGWRLL
jgi:hypothetical protein